MNIKIYPKVIVTLPIAKKIVKITEDFSTRFTIFLYQEFFPIVNSPNNSMRIFSRNSPNLSLNSRSK